MSVDSTSRVGRVGGRRRERVEVAAKTISRVNNIHNKIDENGQTGQEEVKELLPVDEFDPRSPMATMTRWRTKARTSVSSRSYEKISRSTFQNMRKGNGDVGVVKYYNNYCTSIIDSIRREKVRDGESRWQEVDKKEVDKVLSLKRNHLPDCPQALLRFSEFRRRLNAEKSLLLEFLSVKLRWGSRSSRERRRILREGEARETVGGRIDLMDILLIGIIILSLTIILLGHHNDSIRQLLHVDNGRSNVQSLAHSNLYYKWTPR